MLWLVHKKLLVIYNIRLAEKYQIIWSSSSKLAIKLLIMQSFVTMITITNRILLLFADFIFVTLEYLFVVNFIIISIVNIFNAFFYSSLVSLKLSALTQHHITLLTWPSLCVYF